MPVFETARRNMIENQLRPSKIDDARLLAAMGETPREVFVPAGLRNVAYSDDDIDLGRGRYLIEPLALAKMLQTARLRPDDVALVVGCPTGYSAAVVSKLAATAFQLVPDQRTADEIENVLAELDCTNVVTEIGNPFDGLPSQAPFDVIIAVGSVARLHDAWQRQLSGKGRLVAVVQPNETGKVTLLSRLQGAFSLDEPFDATIPPLPGEPVEQAFAF